MFKKIFGIFVFISLIVMAWVFRKNSLRKKAFKKIKEVYEKDAEKVDEKIKEVQEAKDLNVIPGLQSDKLLEEYQQEKQQRQEKIDEAEKNTREDNIKLRDDLRILFD